MGIRKSYGGAAVATTLNGAISGAATTIVVTNGTTYPDGSAGKFVIAIDRGLATEEKVLITSRSGNSMTVSSRGYDGTAAQAHADLAVVEHVLDAVSVDEANRLSSLLTAAGDIFYRDGTDVQRLALGAVGMPLVAGASAPTWGPVGAAAGLVRADGTTPFTALQAGPATDPVGVNDLTRKAYVNAQDAVEAAARLLADQNPIACDVLARRVANQTITTATQTAITWDNEDHDTDAFFTAGSTGITIPAGKGGTYLVTYSLKSVTANVQMFIELFLDGVSINVGNSTPDTTGAQIYWSSGSCLLLLAAGNILSVRVYHTGGTTKDVNTGRFYVCRLSA